MATVTLNLTGLVSTRVFTTLMTQPTRDRSSEPFGMLTCSANALAVAVVGAGDTQITNTDFVMPPNFVYKLNSFNMVLESETNVETSHSCSLTMNVPDAAGADLQVSYPLSKGTGFAGSNFSGSSLDLVSIYTFGTWTDDFQGDEVGQINLNPFNMPSQVFGPQTARVSFDSPANAPASILRIWFQFLMFNEEQNMNSGLFWPMPTRNS